MFQLAPTCNKNLICHVKFPWLSICKYSPRRERSSHITDLDILYRLYASEIITNKSLQLANTPADCDQDLSRRKMCSLVQYPYFASDPTIYIRLAGLKNGTHRQCGKIQAWLGSQAIDKGLRPHFHPNEAGFHDWRACGLGKVGDHHLSCMM